MSYRAAFLIARVEDGFEGHAQGPCGDEFVGPGEAAHDVALTGMGEG